MSENLYNIKAVCKLTGLNEHTLRAWERRYQAIAPSRQDNRRRLYSREDVERLRWLVGLVSQGYAIGQIAALADRELRDLVSQHELLTRQTNHGTQIAAQSDADTLALDRVLHAVRRLDLAALQSELEQIRVNYGALDLALKILLPLMAEVGRLIIAEELDIGHEHALSALVRAQLLDILFQLKRLQAVTRGANPPSFTVVAATPEGDLHEIGLLIGSIICAANGIDVAYIGPNMPPEPLARVATVLRADAVLIGLSPLPPGILPRTTPEYLALLAPTLPPACELWLGGTLPPAAQLGSLPRLLRTYRSLHELQADLLERRSAALRVQAQSKI